MGSQVLNVRLWIVGASTPTVNIRSRSRPLGHAAKPIPLCRPLANIVSKNFEQVVLHAVRADQQTEAVDTKALEQIANITRIAEEKKAGIVADNVQKAKSAAPPQLSQLKQKVLVSIKELQEGLLERETEVRLLLLAALAGEHLLLLGPPGTAKSELSRRLSKLTGGRYYERLLTRFSVPEELFGPLSMKGLENDQYVRQIDGYLPTAEVAFIDEIFKANSAILNALLTLLNERLFDNGNERAPVPLLCLVGASNELPESEELDALYDRFLIRRQVSQVSQAQLKNLARLAAGSLPSQEAAEAAASNGNGHAAPSNLPDLTMPDFQRAADEAYEAVDLPDSVLDLLVSLRQYLQDKCEPPVYVSDRRFMKAVNLLQVAAHADGRDEANEFDCLLLEHVFGNRPDDAHKVRAFVLDTISSDPGLQQTEIVLVGMVGRAIRLLSTPSSPEVAEAVEEVADLVELLQRRHEGLAGLLQGDFPLLRSSVWNSEAASQSAVQTLSPPLNENLRKCEELLREGLMLKGALEAGIPAPTLEKLLPKRVKQFQRGVEQKA
eukprot:jgi/Botrbrau1/21881/Bobra.0249s0010.1